MGQKTGQSAPEPRPESIQKRFSINPIEMGIFAVVGMLFLNSAYNLFYQSPALQAESRGIWSNGESRLPASKEAAQASSSLMGQVIVPCNMGQTGQGADATKTKAMRVRLLVELCGEKDLKQANVKNMTLSHPFEATVFADSGQTSFSTDYIPLDLGKNELTIELTLASGKVTSRKIEVTRETKN